MIGKFVELGGPVVAVLLVTSMLAGAVTIYKFWQFRTAGVERHKVLKEVLNIWDDGDAVTAGKSLKQCKSYLAPIVGAAMVGSGGKHLPERLDAEAAAAFERLEGGFGTLDSIAQLAPLLGLFGTVLGMTEAFQK